MDLDDESFDFLSKLRPLAQGTQKPACAYWGSGRRVTIQSCYSGVVERAAESRTREEEAGAGPVVECAGSGGGMDQDGEEDVVRKGGKGVFGGIVGGARARGSGGFGDFRAFFLAGRHFW